MLQLKIDGGEYFDESRQTFVPVKSQILQLEHSLVSISKWEAKWHKPFLRPEPMTREETLDYIRFMTMTQNVDPLIYKNITNDHVNQVMSYINDSMTATTIKPLGGKKKGPKQVLTSEVIYYYMTAYQIPFDPCQKWHLNRLMTLIQVCDEKSEPGKKMSKKDVIANNRALNAARKAKHHTRG